MRLLRIILLSLFLVSATFAEPKPVKYGKPVQVGTLKNTEIRESSGLACSNTTEKVFWTHNDSGDTSRIFAFNEKGEELAQITIAGVTFRDCEDMCSFKFRNKPFLLIADTGDNKRVRTDYTLYIIPEPKLDPKKRGLKGKIPPAVTIKYMYPDGPHDCEGVGVDPVSKTILMVTKRGNARHVYELAMPDRSPRVLLKPKQIGTLKLPSTTAMDVSPDGKRAIVLVYGPACIYTRGENETWKQAFARKPRTINMPPRRQGESICYGPDGKSIYLTSEKTPTPLWKVPAQE